MNMLKQAFFIQFVLFAIGQNLLPNNYKNRPDFPCTKWCQKRYYYDSCFKLPDDYMWCLIQCELNMRKFMEENKGFEKLVDEWDRMFPNFLENYEEEQNLALAPFRAQAQRILEEYEENK